ncbi:hypothetical protein RJT34_32629 [Clitoria ternatea]|uniref:Uncharacterized protein n=1 Tax=Clitoria ternatea TaxID=43366 RepID=A0AAN9I2H8_CLITE
MTTMIPFGLKEIQKVQQSFIWGHHASNCKWHAVNWETLTLRKAHGWAIGDGRSVNFWYDIWLKRSPLHLARGLRSALASTKSDYG